MRRKREDKKGQTFQRAANCHQVFMEIMEQQFRFAQIKIYVMNQ